MVGVTSLVAIIVWINGAVGITGSENNPANLLYGGVLVVGIIGAFYRVAVARSVPTGRHAISLPSPRLPGESMGGD